MTSSSPFRRFAADFRVLEQAKKGVASLESALAGEFVVSLQLQTGSGTSVSQEPCGTVGPELRIGQCSG